HLATVARCNDAAFNDKRIHVHTPALRGLLQQEAPGLGRGIAQGNGGDLQRGAGDGCTLIRCPLGVAEDHRDLIHLQVQLLGDDLRQRGANAGAEVNVTVEGIYAAVLVDGNEQPQLHGPHGRRTAFGHRAGRRQDVVDDQQHAILGEQLVACGQAAQVGRQFVADLRFGGMRVAVEQGFGGHDHAVHAITALRGLFINEGLLHRMRAFARTDALQRGDVPAVCASQRKHARAGGDAIDDDRTGAAFTQTASVFGAIKMQLAFDEVVTSPKGSRKHASGEKPVGRRSFRGKPSSLRRRDCDGQPDVGVSLLANAVGQAQECRRRKSFAGKRAPTDGRVAGGGV
nr:hypothetical protein [Tanacetum cinerariifolium]